MDQPWSGSCLDLAYEANHQPMSVLDSCHKDTYHLDVAAMLPQPPFLAVSPEKKESE